MKKVIMVFVLLMFTFPVMPVNVLIDENITLNDNIFSDYTEVSDAVNKLSLIITKKSLSKTSIFWWSVNTIAENYLKNDTESNYVLSGFVKNRFKFTDSILDISGTILYDYYSSFTTGNVADNPAYSHLIGSFFTQYRYDFDKSSIYFAYALSKSFFQEYNLDSLTHRFSFLFSLDLSLFTTINFKALYAYTGYSERYVIDSSANATDTAFVDNLTGFEVGVKHFFNPGFFIKLSGFYELLKSNGNFYFYGPNETVLVLDGDEEIFGNYYSYGYYGVRFEVSKDFDIFKVNMGLEYSDKKYDSKPAMNSSDMYIPATTEIDRFFSVSLDLKLHLSEKAEVYINGKYKIMDSNSYKSHTTALIVGAGTRIWF
ncbi:MAG: hypothetical protein KAR07_04625 [Spirochaetes bacterium]|nr:hypothetical protein [Spirochaetota bacterium]